MMDKEKYSKPSIESTDVEIGVYGPYGGGSQRVKEKYLKPKVESTDVEIGVYGTYCDGGYHYVDGQCVLDNV